jgi:nucleotide-binding universal stress UspA family protein
MRILCAVDGSECSRWGVQALEALADREPEDVTLLHVVDPSALRASRDRNPVAKTRALAAMDKAGGVLLREAERLARVALGQAATGPSTTLHHVLAHGPIARTIVRQARRVKADLILLGSRGLSDIRGFLLGSISRQIASIAPCSLLVVKQPLLQLTRVVLAVDDSKHSRAAARFLRSRMLPEAATTTILSSAERPVTDLAVRYLSKSQVAALELPVLERATQLVTTMRDEFLKEGYTVVSDVKMDHVIDTIVTQVEADHADLLVIGARELTKSERLYLGSVSESLLRHAPCSVLIVRGARA